MKMLTLIKRSGEKTVFPGGAIRSGETVGCADMVVIGYSSGGEKRSTFICPWADVKEITIEGGEEK